MRFLLGTTLVVTNLLITHATRAQTNLTLGQRLAADLTWTQQQRDVRFAHMDQHFPVNRIRGASCSTALPHGRRLGIQLAAGERLQSIMVRDHLAGILVLQNGRIRLEQYSDLAGKDTRWTSFSISKSVTASLVGFALRDRLIHSADDDVTRYIPELAGSAYQGVTVRQLAQMTSGVRWIEDYTAPDSDNVRLYTAPLPPGAPAGYDQVVEYMRRLPRESEPGTKFVYKTGETDLLGVLIQRATGMSLSAFAERTLWPAMGGRSSAFWIADHGREFGGSGLSATLEDFGRFGEFVRTHRESGWLAEATRGGADGGRYGLGWWTYPDGSFAALGIFGQSILVDPKRELVVVILGAWPQASSEKLVSDRAALWASVRAAVDAERSAAVPSPSP